VIAQQIIEKKRDGHELSSDELTRFMDGYMSGVVTEYQMSSFLMAVVFRGLGPSELGCLVECMIHSGQTLDPEGDKTPRVDKHSTGGVGDKVSLVLAPLAAELGLVVPMMSGRGLGHTGGTLDKLEAIPGFRTDLTLVEFSDVLRTNGCAMIGQTEEIAPLDKRLYALRSVTATVSSIPLIAASIMSKKLSESLSGLVLDVKVGRGGFLPQEDDAEALARTMVDIGAEYDVATVAVLTGMDNPLGRTIGNALEVREAVDCLSGAGPSDLREVVIELAAEMAVVGGVAGAVPEARLLAGRRLDDGRAMERFERMVRSQGGDESVLHAPDRMGVAPETATVTADRDGFLSGFDPRILGHAVVELGGGRTALGQNIDARVGFELHVAAGSPISTGQPVGTVHAADADGMAVGVARLLAAAEVTPEPPPPAPVIRDRIA